MQLGQTFPREWLLGGGREGNQKVSLLAVKSVALRSGSLEFESPLCHGNLLDDLGLVTQQPKLPLRAVGRIKWRRMMQAVFHPHCGEWESINEITMHGTDKRWFGTWVGSRVGSSDR